MGILSERRSRIALDHCDHLGCPGRSINITAAARGTPGGQANPNAMISHPGGVSFGAFGGVPWNPPFAYLLGFTSLPGLINGFTVTAASGQVIGFGGEGGFPASGNPGFPGYVLLTW